MGPRPLRSSARPPRRAQEEPLPASGRAWARVQEGLAGPTRAVGKGAGSGAPWGAGPEQGSGRVAGLGWGRMGPERRPRGVRMRRDR